MTEVKNYIEEHIELEKHILYKLFNIVRYLFFIKGFVLGFYLIKEAVNRGNSVKLLALGLIAIIAGILETPWVSKWLLKDIKYLISKHKRLTIEIAIFIVFAIILLITMLIIK